MVNSTQRFCLAFCLCVFQSFKHCDHLAWGRQRWSVCFTCVSLFCARWFVSLSSSSFPLGVKNWLRLVIVALLWLVYVAIGYKDTYFVRDHSDAPQKYSDADVIKTLEYPIDNIFVEFGGRIFQQTIGVPMGTNCAPLLADLFLYLYEAEFEQSLLKAGKKQLAQQFSFTNIYINDVLVTEKHKICRVFGIHISTWTWNKRKQRRL